MSKTITIKCLPEYFEAANAGIKPWELRYDDRNYAVGDLLIMREWKDGKYTGRQLTGKITYILRNFTGLAEGWVILSFERSLQ